MSGLRDLRDTLLRRSRTRATDDSAGTVQRPVFILGCGRSGTTILGQSLAKHPRVTYLNEPRRLWFAAYPETDIWTARAERREGRLVLTASDVRPEATRELHRRFLRETRRRGRPVLVEKLPANSFRLGFIHRMFPDARFVHIHRNGREVARSIEKQSRKWDWYGKGGYKWRLLCALAATDEATAELPALCATVYEKGLLEWRLSTTHVVRFLRDLPQDAFCEVSYDAFMRDPADTLRAILASLELPVDEAVTGFVDRKVARRSAPLDAQPLSPKEKKLGGKLLALSLEPREGLGLTRRFV